MLVTAIVDFSLTNVIAPPMYTLEVFGATSEIWDPVELVVIEGSFSSRINNLPLFIPAVLLAAFVLYCRYHDVDVSVRLSLLRDIYWKPLLDESFVSLSISP